MYCFNKSMVGFGGEVVYNVEVVVSGELFGNFVVDDGCYIGRYYWNFKMMVI